MAKKGNVVEVEKRNQGVVVRVRQINGIVNHVFIFDEDVIKTAAKLIATQQGVHPTVATVAPPQVKLDARNSG